MEFGDTGANCDDSSNSNASDWRETPAPWNVPLMEQRLQGDHKGALGPKNIRWLSAQTMRTAGAIDSIRSESESFEAEPLNCAAERGSRDDGLSYAGCRNHGDRLRTDSQMR